MHHCIEFVLVVMERHPDKGLLYFHLVLVMFFMRTSLVSTGKQILYSVETPVMFFFLNKVKVTSVLYFLMLRHLGALLVNL